MPAADTSLRGVREPTLLRAGVDGARRGVRIPDLGEERRGVDACVLATSFAPWRTFFANVLSTGWFPSRANVCGFNLDAPWRAKKSGKNAEDTSMSLHVTSATGWNPNRTLAPRPLLTISAYALTMNLMESSIICFGYFVICIYGKKVGMMSKLLFFVSKIYLLRKWVLAKTKAFVVHGQ